MDASSAHDRGGVSVPAMVLRAADDFSRSIAVRADGRDCSYAELVRRALALTEILRAHDVSPGDLIALVLPRGIERIVSTLAIWCAGAAPLFLDPVWPHARLAEIVQEARCGLVIGDDTEPNYAGTHTFVYREPETPSDHIGSLLEIKADTLAYVIPTSGSSGRPKLVEITHGNLTALVGWHNQAFAVSANDHASHLAGLGFDAAVWEVWPYLASGASIEIAPERVRSDAVGLRDWLVATGTTLAFAPTLTTEHLVRLPWPEAKLRFLLTGGDRLRVAPPPGLPFALVNNYGPTECTVVACSGTVPPEPVTASPPSIGTPIAGSVVRILDPDGHPAATGMTGEIWIGGANVGRGYRGDPTATGAAFRPDPSAADPDARLYRTGDLGSWRSDGSIDFHGRADDQLKVRGHRIEPGEVSAVLARHPRVSDAAVVGVERGDEMVLVAYVQSAPAAVPGGEELRDFVGRYLPDWSVPTLYVRVDALPVTASGKLDRGALPVPNDDNRLPSRAFAAPATPTEAQLLAIMAESMGGRDIGVEDNFFLLGGHSLLGTQVVLRAGERFEVELTLRHLFNAPTIRQLARLIETLVEELVAGLSEEEVLLRAHG